MYKRVLYLTVIISLQAIEKNVAIIATQPVLQPTFSYSPDYTHLCSFSDRDCKLITYSTGLACSCLICYGCAPYIGCTYTLAECIECSRIGCLIAIASASNSPNTLTQDSKILTDKDNHTEILTNIND